jgi:cephalosporin-C deacetylase-like acetyl esterase
MVVPVAARCDAPPTFAYDNYAPLDLSIETIDQQGSVTVTDLSYRSQSQIVHAILVAPRDPSGVRPAVLFARDVDASDDASTAFLEDAKWLARRGTTSLIPEPAWTLPGWMRRVRTYDSDARDTVAFVIALRRGLDLLGTTTGVDKTRLAIVGAGLGATYAALLTGVDSRPVAAVFDAPDPSLSALFVQAANGPHNVPLLNAPPLPLGYASGLALFDIRGALARSSFIQSLLQFGTQDRLVSKSDAAAIVDAIPGNKKRVVFYETGHDLDGDAPTDERRLWLGDHLLKP